VDGAGFIGQDTRSSDTRGGQQQKGDHCTRTYPVFGVGKLYLRVGTTNVYFLGGWRASLCGLEVVAI
jgi:hypothetical protein